MVKCRSKNVYFMMDITTRTYQDLATMDKIQRKLENAGFKVNRVVNNRGYGSNGAAIYFYLYNRNIKNSIVFFLCNGVDPSNIREGVQTDTNDGSGYWYSRRALKPLGNVLVMGWWYGACDCVNPGGSCYNSVRGSETSGRLYHPKQYMDQHGILYFCERNDRTGDASAEAFIRVVNANMAGTVPESETVNPSNTDSNDQYSSDAASTSTDSTKTLSEQTIVETLTNAYYQKIVAVKTDKNGMFTLPLKLPYAGKYSINAHYAGNKNYEGCTATVELDNYAGEQFKQDVLEVSTTNKYTDGTSDTKVEGNKGTAKHTVTRTTVNKYTNGAISDTTTTIVNNDDVTVVTPQVTPTDTSQTNTVTPVPVGDIKDPFTAVVPLAAGGLPNVAAMKHNNYTFEMVDLKKTYTLTEAMYTEVFYRDSKSLQLNSYRESKYTAFRCKEDNKYHVLERERWNAIEESIYYWRALGDKVKYTMDDPGWASEIIIDFPNKRTKLNGTWMAWKAEKCTYHFCADAQDTNYTCGPTSCSVCTQVLHKYYPEKKMQQLIGADGNGSGAGSHQSALRRYGFTAGMYYTNLNVAIEWLKTNRPTVFHYYGHYVAFVDISSDGQKILIANSSTSDHAPLTGWKSLSTIRSYRLFDYTVKVGLDWNISNEEAAQINNFYKSMGGAWAKEPNLNETLRRTYFNSY